MCQFCWPSVLALWHNGSLMTGPLSLTPHRMVVCGGHAREGGVGPCHLPGSGGRPQQEEHQPSSKHHCWWVPSLTMHSGGQLKFQKALLSSCVTSSPYRTCFSHFYACMTWNNRGIRCKVIAFWKYALNICLSVCGGHKATQCVDTDIASHTT